MLIVRCYKDLFRDVSFSLICNGKNTLVRHFENLKINQAKICHFENIFKTKFIVLNFRNFRINIQENSSFDHQFI
jgi:hypothetical protein